MTLTIRTMLLLLCIFLTSPVLPLQAAAGKMPAAARQKQASYVISGIDAAPAAEGYTIRIKGNCEPAFTQYELVNPLRIVLDVANASLSGNLHLPMNLAKGPVVKITASPQRQNSSSTHLEFYMAADSNYIFTQQGNDIVVAFSGDMKRVAPDQTKHKVKLTAVNIDKNPNQTVVHLRANGPLSGYKYTELPASGTSPARLYIDLKNVSGKAIDKVISVGTALAQIRTAQRGDALRLVFDANGDSLFKYQIDRQKDGLDVKIAKSGGTSDAVAMLLEQNGKTAHPLADAKKIKVAMRPAPAKHTAAQSAGSVPDAFSYAGYKEKRISVDFYKIDLHNVFRLIGDISGKNIVVDDGVNGSLTLSLHNVPWDFALDIILNLKGLQMEERYNTIVISQKSKHFKWPEKAQDTMAIKANPLTVTKLSKTPPAVLKAQRLVAEAQRYEADKKFKAAIKMYEQAQQALPANAEVPTRMAAIYLVDLKLYPQAVHYAKEALKIKGHDSNAALLAAIGLANMKMDAEAKDYFDIAVSAPKPSSDALLSYAAFQEEGGNYPSALAMLERHADLYGDTLDTMISKARLYDKNGEPQKAVEEYRAALLSGNPLPQDLKRYIEGRIALGNQHK